MYQSEAEYYYYERREAYWRLVDELSNLRENIAITENEVKEAYALWEADEENEKLADRCSELDEELSDLIRYECKLEDAIADFGMED